MAARNATHSIPRRSMGEGAEPITTRSVSKPRGNDKSGRIKGFKADMKITPALGEGRKPEKPRKSPIRGNNGRFRPVKAGQVFLLEDSAFLSVVLGPPADEGNFHDGGAQGAPWEVRLLQGKVKRGAIRFVPVNLHIAKAPFCLDFVPVHPASRADRAGLDANAAVDGEQEEVDRGCMFGEGRQPEEPLRFAQVTQAMGIKGIEVGYVQVRKSTLVLTFFEDKSLLDRVAARVENLHGTPLKVWFAAYHHGRGKGKDLLYALQVIASDWAEATKGQRSQIEAETLAKAKALFGVEDKSGSLPKGGRNA